METTLSKWGNSFGISLPKHILDKYELRSGLTLKIEEHREGILLKKENPITLKEIISSYRDTKPIEDCFPNTLPSEEWE